MINLWGWVLRCKAVKPGYDTDEDKELCIRGCCSWKTEGLLPTWRIAAHRSFVFDFRILVQTAMSVVETRYSWDVWLPEWICSSGGDGIHGDYSVVVGNIWFAGDLEAHLHREVTAGGEGNHGKEPLEQPEKPSWLLQRLHVEGHPDWLSLTHFLYWLSDTFCSDFCNIND